MKLFLFLLGSLLTTAPSLASPIPGASPGINAVATNQATNNQSAIGTVNQSPVGGVNSNYQINNSQATDYGFAPGIYCRGANFSVGGYGSGATSDGFGNGTSANNFGAIALFTVPIGGETQEACKSLAKEIVKQRQLDTAYNLIKVCSALKKENIVLNYEAFPDFKICESVNIMNINNVPDISRDPFTPKDNTTITVPVK